MFNHSQKIISLVWAVPLLLTVSVTESKAAINKTTIENTSSNTIAALEPKAIGFSGSPRMSLSEQNLIVDCVGSLTSSVTGTETTTKTKKIFPVNLPKDYNCCSRLGPINKQKNVVS